MKRDILIATTNPGKIAEIKTMLEADVNWLSLSDFSALVEIKEDGKTFTENARKKAAGYAEATGLWTLADDSGLVIDALGGEPGVKSARFSGSEDRGQRTEDRNSVVRHPSSVIRFDHQNIAKVLKLLKDVPAEKRTARFICCLCLASPDKILAETQGILEGLITEREIGENGFGYDPIFFVPHLNKTVGQLTAEEKNAISHRGSAVRKLKPLLLQLLKTNFLTLP